MTRAFCLHLDTRGTSQSPSCLASTTTPVDQCETLLLFSKPPRAQHPARLWPRPPMATAPATVPATAARRHTRQTQTALSCPPRHLTESQSAIGLSQCATSPSIRSTAVRILPLPLRSSLRVCHRPLNGSRDQCRHNPTHLPRPRHLLIHESSDRLQSRPHMTRRYVPGLGG